MKSLTQCPEWLVLQAQQQKMASVKLHDLFAQDPDRAQRFNISAAGLYLDYSKNHVDQDTINLLIQLAHVRQLPQQINALFNGEIVNQSEKMPALHTALRHMQSSPVFVQGQNVIPVIHASWDKMKNLTARIQQDQYLGYSGKPIRDIVNVGVGGSHWAPTLLYHALKSDVVSTLRCHFIANLDEAAFLNVVRYLNPETTLFIITSKSFSTAETMQNYYRAKRWLLSAASKETLFKDQLIAVTENIEKAHELGFADENIFPLWSWVGGRFSIWSAVGLAAAIVIGWDKFYEFLSGADAMDQHFQQADLSQNMPVLLALLSIWYNNFFDWHSHAIIPYSQCLAYLPGYLQQLHMESLGKRCQQDGRAVDYATGTIIFGDVGTDSQHSFHQFFFQGTARVPIDFILPLSNPYNHRYQLRMVANCLGQSKTLMQGYESTQIYQDLQAQGLNSQMIEVLVPHKIIPENSPTNTILMNELTPRHLGALLALYEHKVYVQSVIWNINAFDQWGVERGKKLSQDLLASLENKKLDFSFDQSTQTLIKRVWDSQ
jgi:glucose-6-phosphate isomerase